MSEPSRYDNIADWYDEYVGDGSGLGAPLFPEVTPEARLLDLGCGQGRTCRFLARRGAGVTGVDISPQLLQIARDREAREPLGVTYLQGDATTTEWWDGEPFLGAVCDMALMDFDDLDGAVRTLASVLSPAGWLVLALFHPCYPGVDGGPASWPAEGGYFSEGRWLPENATGVRGLVGANHRTLSTYLNVLLENGFAVDRLREPEIGAVPLILLVRAFRSR